MCLFTINHIISVYLNLMQSYINIYLSIQLRIKPYFLHLDVFFLFSKNFYCYAHMSGGIDKFIQIMKCLLSVNDVQKRKIF